MLRIEFGGKRSAARNCERMTRRHALQIGGAGLLGGGLYGSGLLGSGLLGSLSLPGLLAHEALGAVTAPKAKSVIFIFLEGGPSTIDMWDPKPDAPAEIRGPFRPIATKVPGTFFGEHCPKSAEVADKFTVVRTHTHEDNGHITGYYYVMTGQKPEFRDGQSTRIPANTFLPSIGSKIAREVGINGPIPPYVNLPAPMDAGGPGFYGPDYAPFVIESDPAQPDFEVKDLRLPAGVSGRRMSRRQQLLSGVEQLQRETAGRAGEMTTYYQKAHELITSPDAQRAFDLQSEPETVRRRYGFSTLGQSALLARRLVEAGCRFIGVDNPGWDTHTDCFPTLKDNLIPQADQAFSALISDLDERGLLDSTLVVMLGEMGRTPRVNKEAGRDHWSRAQSVLMAGGGIRNGQVIGETDEHASEPISCPVTIADLHRTIYTLMGIQTNKSYLTPLGRPVPILDGGQVIPGLIS